MALTKKLTKIGNSYGIVISKEIMNLINLKPDSEVEISVEKGGLFIHPVQKEDQLVSEAFSKFVQQYDDTLKKLSE